MDTINSSNEILALGNSLRQINQNLLKKDIHAGTMKIWYQGGEPYFDVFFEIKDDDIIWFQFTLRGKYLVWEKKHPKIKTGTTNELMIDDVSYYPASKLTTSDINPDWDFIKLVRSILQIRPTDKFFAQALTLFPD